MPSPRLHAIPRLLCLAAAIVSCSVQAQPLAAWVQSLDASHLPRITMKAKLYRAGMPVQHPNRATLTLSENGIPIPAVVDCPDSAAFNSIALVLDNSGTMSGASLTSLISAARQFIDSLRSNDMAMLVDFNLSTGRILQDLTTDKALLKARTTGLLAGGGTPLWSASLLGVQRIAANPGHRVCLIFSDGTDNSSSVGPDTVAAVALRAGITIYTIGYGSAPLADKTLADLAASTGGRFFRIFSPPEIVSIFNTIVSEVVSGACTISWDAASCADSVRALSLEARLDGETAVWDSLWRAPYRRDTLMFRVIAPAAVAPGGNANVYIAVEPGLHTGLATSFRFLLRHDPALLTVTPMLPITPGTMTQNTSSTMRQLRPGVLLFAGDAIRPAFNTGNLIGVRFKGVAADSSRPVVLTIDSMALDVGCAATVLTAPDTIDVCQCFEAVTAWLEPVNFATVDRELRLPIFIRDTIRTAPLTWVATLDYDASRMTPMRVETEGSVSASAHLEWSIDAPGRLRIVAWPAFPPADATTLAAVVFHARHGTRADTTALVLPFVRAYARCCPEPLPDTSGAALIEGICDRVMLRNPAITLQQNIPNPVSRERGWTSIPYSLDAPGHVVITLYDAMGKTMATIVDADMDAGTHVFELSTRDFPRGVYTIMLRSGSLRGMTRRMVLQ